MNGNQYKGEWINDKKNGKGTYKSKKTGEFYNGEWIVRLIGIKYFFFFQKDNERSGTGIYNYSNGDFYEGQWKKD